MANKYKLCFDIKVNERKILIESLMKSDIEYSVAEPSYKTQIFIWVKSFDELYSV